ncbi:FliH/SctL family protein, partial [Azospirillum brasilense]|uniref:FliH/SctL family protein n=1 Tax=Azospirillum brasilense TaxID=192 RepID=UPI0034CDA144
MACDIARQVVRQELSSGPQALLPVVREALGMLVAEGRPATVRIHPSDWSFLEQPLTTEYAGAKIQWVPDASVAEGDCRYRGGRLARQAVAPRHRGPGAFVGLADRGAGPWLTVPPCRIRHCRIRPGMRSCPARARAWPRARRW